MAGVEVVPDFVGRDTDAKRRHGFQVREPVRVRAIVTDHARPGNARGPAEISAGP